MKAKIFDFENKDDNGKYLYSDEYSAATKDLEMILHKYVPDFSRNLSELIVSKIFVGDIKYLVAYKKGESA